jgi:ABC-type sugar transport system ATPase subunit
MTVFKNMAFPLEARRLPKERIQKQVIDTADLLGLTPLLKRYPRQLSGGQRQRVAIGRAIVRQPDVFLMDEPLSNLDARLRVETRAEIKRLQQELSITTVYVTHDQAEAMTLADQLVVMRGGRVLQSGPPEEVYRCPQQQFVAGFIGNPGMNFIPGHRASGSFVTPQFTYTLPDALTARLAALPERTELVLGIRPESVRVSLEPGPEAIPATVVLAEALGKETLLTLACGTHTLKAYVSPDWSTVGAPSGAGVWLTFDPAAIHLFDAHSEKVVEAPV